jgi:membrane protein insertase Oxa1/YidC/SpoIIIJ
VRGRERQTQRFICRIASFSCDLLQAVSDSEFVWPIVVWIVDFFEVVMSHNNNILLFTTSKKNEAYKISYMYFYIMPTQILLVAVHSA